LFVLFVMLRSPKSQFLPPLGTYYWKVLNGQGWITLDVLTNGGKVIEY
jgi:hypothetical protein